MAKRLLLTVGLMFVSSSSFATPPSFLEPRCEELSFAVALAPGQDATYQVAGTLCSRGPVQHRTIQVLLHGSTYGQYYWDFPYQPQQYSYVRALTSVGFATLALDRIGSGASDHPDPDLINVTSNAYVVHQVIEQLKGGHLVVPRLGAIRHNKIILVGHSLGSIITTAVASAYPTDVDGVIVTGFFHSAGPKMADVQAALFPAFMDPAFASMNLPFNYFTTIPGMRGVYYRPETTDPQVLAVDEANKQTVTMAEMLESPNFIMASLGIQVPVLSVIGDYDLLFCQEPTCTATSAAAMEPYFYSPQACLKTVVIPETGHDLNLHRTAPLFFGVAAAWSIANVGLVPEQPLPLRCR
ncbi:MAG: alpha/beta hydrolase [Myxococcales bacterium]